MHEIGNALLGGAASSLCALECDAFNVPLGAANLDLSNKRLGAAAATLLAGVIKGNTTIMSLKCVQFRISHMVAQCLRWSQAPSLVVSASNRPLALAFASGPADRKANTFCAHRLDENRLGPKGGAALAEGIKGNSTLQSLS